MRTVGVDYGDKRIGVSFSDISGTLAGESFTIFVKNINAALEELCETILSHGASEIVLGYPKHMNADIGDRAKRSEEVAEFLREKTGLPVVLWDERCTTVDAHRILSETGHHGKSRRNKVDSVAASLILQNYLDFKANSKQKNI
ncbi:MAG: Holliday junction resolvase RuvX [Oscillospiraceae bacterium]|nr:Holliday junction resolvase RuvX [Oscillospiraceae bacterium]